MSKDQWIALREQHAAMLRSRKEGALDPADAPPPAPPSFDPPQKGGGCVEFLFCSSRRRSSPKGFAATEVSRPVVERSDHFEATDVELNVAISRLCIRQCLCADVDTVLLDVSEATSLEDLMAPVPPTLDALATVARRCPLVDGAFGDEADEARVTELRCSVDGLIASGRLRAIASGWRVRTRVVAFCASPLVYAVALGSVSEDQRRNVAADGYDAEDWGECYDATQRCVAQIIVEDRSRSSSDSRAGSAAFVKAVAAPQPEKASSSDDKPYSMADLSVRAMCSASRGLLQRAAARFMAKSANRRLLSVAYHVAPTSALRQACLREVGADVERLDRWLSVMLETRAMLGGQSVAQYWTLEALGLDRTENSLVSAKNALNTSDKALFATEVASAQKAADEAALSKKQKNHKRRPSSASLSNIYNKEEDEEEEEEKGAEETPHDRRRTTHERVEEELVDAAALILDKCRHYETRESRRSLAAALRLEAERQRKSQLVEVVGSPEFCRFCHALLPSLLASPASSLLGDGAAAAGLVDAVVAAWRALARGDGFKEDSEEDLSLHERVYMALSRVVSTPERSYEERVAAYEAPMQRLVDAALGLCRSACARDAELWTELLDWLARDFLALWHSGADEALDAFSALRAFGEANGPESKEKAMHEADDVLRATKLHKQRKRAQYTQRLALKRDSKKQPGGIYVAPQNLKKCKILVPTIDLLQDLAMAHFRPNLDNFMGTYADRLKKQPPRKPC